MILNSFKLNTVIVQLQYADAFELWDNAGAIGRQLCAIWPGLKVVEGQPQNQTLKANGVTIRTGFSVSTITLSNLISLESKINQVQETFDVWRKMLALGEVKRVSTRGIHVKEFPSMKDANAELFSFNLVRWPTTKVFDQPLEAELNGVEMIYRFEDQNSFSVLRLKAERLEYEAELNADFFEEPAIHKSKNHMVIDFDRGLLGTINADKFRMDDWLKGYQHVLRRDLEKVIKD